MVLTFNNASIRGVITSSEAHHLCCSNAGYPGLSIDPAEYMQLGEVTNTPYPAINNGAIVTLNAGSKWTVTGTSYLTQLNIAVGASITAPHGQSVSMTVNGTSTPIVPGNTYTGTIELTII
jgi:hypothetical protein